MNSYIPLLSPEVKAFLPHNQVVSGHQSSGAGGQPGCCALGSDKHNRSSGLTTTHAHPCPCPCPGCWNSLAKGMDGYFSAYALSNCTPNAVLSGTARLVIQSWGFFAKRCNRFFFGYVWLFNLKWFFWLGYARFRELVYIPLFPLKFDLLALCTWGIFLLFISAWQPWEVHGTAASYILHQQFFYFADWISDIQGGIFYKT